MREAKFSVGAQVELNSGGPAMTVANMRTANDTIEYLCTWTDTGGQAWHQWFSEPTLKPYQR